MGSSKKERGKQRKAEKSNATRNNINLDPSRLVRLIQRGNDDATKFYCSNKYKLTRDKTGVLLSSVLGYLQRCDNENFDEVLIDIRGRLYHSSEMQIGDLECPSIWVNVLYHVGMLQPSYYLQIAQSIGPLVKCMCGDMKRLFFQNNKHWFETIPLFSALVWSMISKSESDVIKALLQHEGLLQSIVQWRFWEQNRPDISEELDADAYSIVYNCGRQGTTLLVAAATNLRESIGSTPVVNKDCLSKGWSDSFVSGLITEIMNSDEYDEEDVSTLRHLIEGADCVDGCVIADMIYFGMKSENYYEDATLAVELVCTMLKKGTALTNVPNDTRVAFAIRASLINMCLELIDKFGCKVRDSKALFLHIENIFKTIHGVALHKKSWKAIRHERLDIQEKLEQLDATITHDSSKKLLDMVKSILDINGAYCCHCNKSLGRKERKQCSGCNLVTYCSEACQKQDWLNGHNRACCKSFSVKTPGQFKGRILPETIPDDERAAAKLQELEINNNMIQLKLFRDHSATIVAQAKLLNIPLCDCIVTFDLHHCPPLVQLGSKKDVDDDTPWTKNITCMFISPNYCEGDESKLVMQRWFFPIDF